jgi:hypothetical protein
MNRSHGRRLKRIDESEANLASLGCGSCYLLIISGKIALLGTLVVAAIYYLLTH